MKKKNWYRGLSLADDKYIAEAHPDNIVKKKRKPVWIPIVAACACLALILGNAWLFVPFDTTPPDVSQYADSEYYGIIQKLNVLTYQPPRYKNQAARIWSFVKSLAELDFLKSGNAAPMDPGLADPEDNYQEITDNQVSGIIEADRIKRSDTHIYYMDNDVLRIYSIDKESSREVGKFSLEDGNNTRAFYDTWEFYLSDDCKTVTVITQRYAASSSANTNRCVKLISLDVSDPENIVKKAEFSITGQYMSSRKVDGSILLLTEFSIYKNTLDFDDESTFLPQIDEGEGAYSVPASNIISPENLNSLRYTVVLKLDEETLDLDGTAAYLSYSEDVYVSKDHVFLTHVFVDKKNNDDGTYTTNSMTEISCLTYGGDTFNTVGSVTVRGYVKDQWSMDEHNGILRVFTTTNETTRSEKYYGDHESPPTIASGISNASLYCVDLSTFEVVASVIDFAPPREEIQSVRFDGDMAYVCTSIEISDPVFFFDLSDINNITYKDTGEIEGFSTSLINLGCGYLLGIGIGDTWDNVKVEVYEEAEDGVRSVCTYEIETADYSTNYKSYYIDRENQLFGFGVIKYGYGVTGKTTTSTRYILLHFDGYELVELVDTELDGMPENMRGVYIDGYMYMFGQKDFKVEKVF